MARPAGPGWGESRLRNELSPDMADGQPLLDATPGNLAASGAAPDKDTLSAARLTLRNQDRAYSVSDFRLGKTRV